MLVRIIKAMLAPRFLFRLDRSEIRMLKHLGWADVAKFNECKWPAIVAELRKQRNSIECQTIGG